MIAYFLGLYALSLLLAYEVTHHEATGVMAKSISDTAESTPPYLSKVKRGRSNKDKWQVLVMSPLSTVLGTILYFVILGSVVYGFIKYGWLTGIGILVGLPIFFALNRVLLVPKADSEYFRRMIIQSLIRRQAYYVRHRDEYWAFMMEDILKRLGVPVSESYIQSITKNAP